MRIRECRHRNDPRRPSQRPNAARGARIDGGAHQHPYLPFISEHDPRCPPFGRVINAKVVALPDGEHAIEAEIEVFEPGAPPRFDGDRAVRFQELPGDTPVLAIDRTFSLPEFQEPVSAIVAMFGRSSPQYEVKKALDPIAVLGIGLGAVTVGKFASSFFSKLGSNAADQFSAYLKEIFQRKKSEQVQLLRFEFEFQHDGRTCRADVILTSPTGDDIDAFLKGGLSQIDRLLPEYIDMAPSLTRYVFQYSNGKVGLTFAVRSDAVPVFPKVEDDA